MVGSVFGAGAAAVKKWINHCCPAVCILMGKSDSGKRDKDAPFQVMARRKPRRG